MRYQRSNNAFQRRFTRRQLLKGGAIGGAGVWALSSLGCGQSGTKEVARTAPQATQPKSGGSVTIVITFDPQGMDPHTATAETMRDINDSIYSTPLSFKPSLTSYDVEPNAVEKWEQPDDMTYVMHLRKGAKWHNVPPVNGRELIAEDIKYTIERISTPKAAFQRRWMFEEMAKIEAVDRYTAKMTMKRPFMPVIYYLADRQTMIVPREAVEAKGDLEDTFIGTGPFIMESYTRNVGAKLKKNPDYFITGRPYLDAINLPIVTDPSARLAAMRSREIDWAPIGYSDLESLQKNPGDLVFITVPGRHRELTGSTNLRLPTNKPPFNDVRVRKALSLGADRQKLINAVADGKGIVSGPISRNLKDWALSEEDTAKYLRYDPAEAKKLLAEAGYSSGLKFSCNASTGRKGWPDTAVALKEQYKAIGIELDVNVMEHSTYVAAQVARSFETMVGTTALEGPDPDFLYNIFHSKGPRNFSNYSNPKIDEILEKQRGIFNKEERKKLIQEAQRIGMEDIHEVYLFAADGFVTYQPYLHGYEYGYGTGFRRSHEYWIDK